MTLITTEPNLGLLSHSLHLYIMFDWACCASCFICFYVFVFLYATLFMLPLLNKHACVYMSLVNVQGSESSMDCTI